MTFKELYAELRPQFKTRHELCHYVAGLMGKSWQTVEGWISKDTIPVDTLDLLIIRLTSVGKLK